MKEFIRKRLPFLRREEEYAIMSPDQSGVHATIVRRISDAAFQIIAREVDVKKLRYDAKIIISLGHRQATTFRMGVAIGRADAGAPITEAELENMVSRGLWKLFNQKRHAAAVKMRSADVAVKVCDADILGVKLDRHRVTDPLGFSAKSVELQCQETLVSQPALAALLEVLPQEQIVSVQEAPMAWPLLVCSQENAPEFLSLSVLSDETVLYRHAAGTLECLDTLAWGSRDILKAAGAFFGVGPDSAEEVIDRYTSGNASQSVLKKVEAVLWQELSLLFKGIEAHNTEQATKQVFIASDFKIPAALLKKRYTFLDAGWISEKLGYTLKSMEGEEGSVDAVLAALAVYHEAHNDTLLTKIAKRRVRWL